MLAVHFTEAESVLGTERLIYYSIVAGEAAFASHAHETALEHFERAVEARHDAPLDAVGARALGGRGIARAANNLEREAAGDVIEAFQFWVTEGDSGRALELAFRPDGSIVILGPAAQMYASALELVEPGSHGRDGGRRRGSPGERGRRPQLKSGPFSRPRLSS